MDRRGERLMRWVTLCLIVVVLVVLMQRAAHPVASRTVGVVRVPARADLPRPAGGSDEARLTRAWCMQLRLDPMLNPPGPEWRMREGLGDAVGYELSWQPASRYLVLSRSEPLPLILGMVQLPSMPREVVWQRLGARLQVQVESRSVLVCFDPEGPSEPDAWWPNGWSVIGSGPLGDSVLAVHDIVAPLAVDASDVPGRDRQRLRQALACGPADAGERVRIGWPTVVPGRPGWRPEPPPGRCDYALLTVRRALLALDGGDVPDWLAFATATQAVSALGSGHRDRDRLALWLAWGEVRRLLQAAMHGEQSIDTVRGSMEALAYAVRAWALPEGPGLLSALLPAVAEQAMRRPRSPRPAAQVLAERQAWLGLLAETAQAVIDSAPRTAPAIQLHALRFIQHASAALGGAGVRSQPMPAEAPSWLTARWRLLAGGSPPANALPPLPSGDPVLAPLVPAMAALQRGAILEPLSAVRLTAAVLEPSVSEEELRRAYEGAGQREARLTAVLVALRHLAEVEAGETPAVEAVAAAVRGVERAVEALGAVDGQHAPDEEALVRYDPLSFALACLAESRLQRHRPAGMQREAWRPPEPGVGPFVRLAPFARLLSADPSGSELIWLHDDQVLPPAWALAAHLAMREVHARARGEAAADWGLLAHLRSYTLPLTLLEPVRAAASMRRRPLAP